MKSIQATPERISQTIKLLDMIVGLEPCSSKDPDQIIQDFMRKDLDIQAALNNITPSGMINDEGVVSYIGSKLIDYSPSGPVLIDIGCNTGKNLTSKAARSFPEMRVIGLDAFDIGQLNQDTSIGVKFSSKLEAISHLNHQYYLHNLSFMVMEAKRDEESLVDQANFVRRTSSDNDYLIISGTRIPESLSYGVIDTAVRASADLIILAPMHDIHTVDPAVPMSRYLKQSRIVDFKNLKRVLGFKYSMRNRDGHYVPVGQRNGVIYHAVSLAKQAVILDMTLHLNDNGYFSVVMNFESGLWGNYCPEHVIMAVNSKTPTLKGARCTKGNCPL